VFCCVGLYRLEIVVITRTKGWVIKKKLVGVWRFKSKLPDISKVLGFFEMLNLLTPSIERHTPEEFNLQQLCCVSLNCRRCLIGNVL
jgi:hypothetical protein